MNLHGATWHNERGYVFRDTGQKECGNILWEYTADPDPLTLQLAPMTFTQPDRHGFTNMGNVPLLFRWAVPEDLHPPSFLIHDAACREYKLYFSRMLYGVYESVPVSSQAAAMIMGMGLHAAGFPKRAKLAWWGVRYFGPQWERGEEPRPTQLVVLQDDKQT